MARLLTLALIASAGMPIMAAAEDFDFFERKVRRLLIAKCGECHGDDEPDGRLTLTSVAGIKKGGSLGSVLVSGKLEQSRLIQAIRYTSKLKMPPDGKLSPGEIAVLEKWVKAGAAMPGGGVSTRPSEFQITDEDRQWWSFQPIGQFEPPEVEHDERVRTALDRFVLRQLEKHGLSLSADAERRSLIRRVTFDLIGLPPTPEEVAEFVNDRRPDAYQRLVERLLASPHYGIRWGRHWLDLARYADTNGGGFDYVYPMAWRYRDYVVRAFNQDKSYTRFLTEQLAGDLLIADTQNEQEHVDRLVATGLLTLAPKGLGTQDKQQMVLDVVDDQIDVLGRSLMGLTLSCARCHDHKFDPIATKDYYALAGIFHSTTTVINTDKNPSYWPERPIELPSVTAARKQYVSRKAANEKAIAEVKKKADADIIAAAKKRLADYLFAAARMRHAQTWQPPVAHWAFDSDAGGIVNAITGSDGMLANVDEGGPIPARADGRLGKALRFVGKKDVVAFDNAKELDFGTSTDFTISLWLRAAKNYSPRTADSIISVRYGKPMWFVALRPSGYNGIYLRHYDGNRTVDIKPSSNRLPQLTNNRWHHIVFTSDRDGDGCVFIDGEKAGQASIAAASKTAKFEGVTSFTIGPSVNAFRGDLDDIAIWDRVLSPSEIATYFEQATDPGRNVAAVQKAMRPTGKNVFTVDKAAQQGLVPSIIKRFISLIDHAVKDENSPWVTLLEPSVSMDAVSRLIKNKQSAIQAILNHKKSNPFVVQNDVAQFYDDNVNSRLSQLTRESEAIEKTQVPAPEMAMIAFDAAKVANLRVHLAGDRKNLGEVAERGFPEIVDVNPEHSRRIDSQSGRLQLARWITSAEHPLTARVFVNHVWKWHFGEGLVRTPDNFGRLGERPSHPELLDWLARRFIESGWSIKDLHRQIVLSSTYKQSSVTHNSRLAEVDSGNLLLGRMNRRRLEGEALRDAMLAVSGRLDPRIGGTVNQWKAKMFSVDDKNAEVANYNTTRRSIYLPVVRGAALHEMLQLFDFGDPNSITAYRDVTTVAPQALFLMNSPFIVDTAKGFARRLEQRDDLDVAARVRLAYELALSRPPSADEQKRVVKFVEQQQDWQRVCHMLLCLNEFAYID